MHQIEVFGNHERTTNDGLENLGSDQYQQKHLKIKLWHHAIYV
jgi:hypothetical protein